MDTFSIIQNFFTRMACRFCGVAFIPDDVHLLGEGEGFYVVRVECHRCGRHNGDAAVGVETHDESEMPMVYPDPEWTEEDFDRLAELEAITPDDVIAAHRFIQNLDDDWMKFIPEEIRERYTVTETE